MKILVMLNVAPNANPAEFPKYLSDEWAQAQTMYRQQVFSEGYFCPDQGGAVLIMESASLTQAGQTIQELPMVIAGLLVPQLVQLAPLPELQQLFEKDKQPLPNWWPE